MKLQIGERIKALRLASDLTQEELAVRAGLSKGFISQLENDQTSIQIDSLADILEGLGLSLAEFFSETDAPRVVFKPSDAKDVEGQGASGFELLIPSSTNNLMDPIKVTLKSGEALDPSDPHPGEQFGYVLKGTVWLTLDGATYKVPSRHCFYFPSDRQHQIGNSGRGEAVFLWVVSPPQM